MRLRGDEESAAIPLSKGCARAFSKAENSTNTPRKMLPGNDLQKSPLSQRKPDITCVGPAKSAGQIGQSASLAESPARQFRRQIDKFGRYRGPPVDPQ